MKCPDCGLVLVKTAVVGMDDSYRCGNCGGVWTKAWVINTMAGEPYNDLRIKKYPSTSLRTGSEGNLKCPADGSRLTPGNEDTLPPDVPMLQCGRCKCWWLSGNSVFDLAEAFRIKAEFAKRWRKSRPVKSLALPVILTVVLVIGLGAAVVAINNQQQVNISAGSLVIGKPTVIFKGNGKAEIRFKTAGDLQTATIKREWDILWSQAYVVGEGDWKVIMVDGINLGETVWVSLDQRIWRLTVGQQQ